MADQNIALGVQVPDSFKSISGMLNFAGQAQQIERGSIELQKARETLQSDISQRKAESSRSQTESRVSAETADPRIEQQRQVTSKAITEAAKAAQDLTQDQRGIVAGVVGTLGRAGIKDVDAYRRELSNLKAVNPNNPGLHAVIDAYGTVLENMPKDADLPKLAIGASQYLLSPTQAQSGLTPSAGTVSLGGSVNQAVTTPSVMGGAPSVNISPVGTPATLPPTAQTVSPSGQPQFVGRAPGTAPDEATAFRMVQEATARGQPATVSVDSAPVAAGAQPGLIPGIEGTVATINKDWADTQAAVKDAGRDIGVLQNIKKYAPGAITGVESDRRSYIAGVAGLLGIKEGEIGKTATDLLIKNSNMQALGGSTDAARVLLEGANPNVHMTKEAIQDAANQVIAQRKMAIEKQKLLLPIKTLVDRGLAPPDVYNAALTKLNKIDPRVLQLPDMDKAEKQKMMNAMTPSQQDSFIKMVREAHALGIGNE